MTMNKATGNFNNLGSPAGTFNFGPVSLGTVLKLLAVRVRGTNMVQPALIGTTTTISNAHCYGVQVVFHGSAAEPCPGGFGLTNFLDAKVHPEGPISSTWAPSTDTSANWVQDPIELNYNGQKFFGAGLDLYISFGNTYAVQNMQVTVGYEVIYTT